MGALAIEEVIVVFGEAAEWLAPRILQVLIAAGIVGAADQAAHMENADEKAKQKTQAVPVDKACSDCEPPECDEIKAKIKKVRDELVQRYEEMREDTKGLYAIRPRAIPGIGSWPGHIVQFEGKKRQMKKLLSEAVAKGCTSGLGEANRLSDLDPPTKPAPKSK